MEFLETLNDGEVVLLVIGLVVVLIYLLNEKYRNDNDIYYNDEEE